MTPTAQIIIPVLDKTLSSKEDWKAIIEYAKGQIKPDLKSESLVDYYTQELLTNHFKTKSPAVQQTHEA